MQAGGCTGACKDQVLNMQWQWWCRQGKTSETCRVNVSDKMAVSVSCMSCETKD